MANVVTDVQVLLQASKGVDTAQKMDVKEIIESELQRLDDGEEDIVTESDLPPEAVVEANEFLPRVFENLIRNGVEHHESTPIQVSVSATKRAGTLSITIADNGPGMPEELRANLLRRQ